MTSNNSTGKTFEIQVSPHYRIVKINNLNWGIVRIAPGKPRAKHTNYVAYYSRWDQVLSSIYERELKESSFEGIVELEEVVKKAEKIHSDLISFYDENKEELDKIDDIYDGDDNYDENECDNDIIPVIDGQMELDLDYDSDDYDNDGDCN